MNTIKSLIAIVLLLTLISSLESVHAATDCAAQSDMSTAECNALIALYTSTNGAAWSDSPDNQWNQDNSPCSWTGVTCSGLNVIEINRNSQGLDGTLPDLSDLNSLQNLYLSSNQLTGGIPDLSALTNLQYLYLGENQLTGDISDLSNLNNLTELGLDNNQLTGDIPTLPTSLVNTNLGYNTLTGETGNTATIKDSDWKDTQTVPPTNLSTTVLSDNKIRVNWTLIPYQTDGGYYQVKYATTSGGPYTNAVTKTADKSVNNDTVTGLTPATTYYFVMETYTQAHGSQQNALTSIHSAEVIAITLSSTTCPSGNTAYVDKTATGVNEGSSWNDAFTELYLALKPTYLSYCTNVTEIHVAQGTYTPGNLRTDTFQLANNLAIYGGYPTGGGTRNSDPATNNTILSGNMGNVNTHADNSYHIVTANNTDNTAILDGFTIQFGRATKSGSGVCNTNHDGRCGAGILNIKGKPTLENLILTKNTAFQSGGGMANLKAGASPILDNVSFISNTASKHGGGIFNETDQLTISNAIFKGNKAQTAKGGGIHINGGTHTLTNVIFSGNKAIDGGGLWNQNAILSTLTNVTLSANQPTGITNKASSLLLSNVILWENLNQEITNNSTVTVNNSIIKGSSGSNWWTDNGITDNGNNLDADPLFVLPVSGSTPNTSGDLHLNSASPAIDAGTNTNCLNADLDGITRPQNGTCDMGAYEADTSFAATGLIATAVSETQINLSWTDNSNNETGFKITRKGSLINTTSANATSYNDTALTCGTTYHYSVQATDGTNDSTADTTSATTQACPVVVTPSVPVISPPTVSYKLSIEKTGSGQVTGEGIDCGKDCLQYFNEGTEVLLTATPTTGWEVNWGGDCDNDGKIIIDRDKSCTANFKPLFALTLQKSRNGTVAYKNADCSGNTCTLVSGSQIQITASPNEGFTFTGWQGDCVGTENPISITLTDNMDCQAQFAKPSQALLTFNMTDNVNGSVTYANTDCHADKCTLASGSQIQMTAIPNAGFSFTGWQGDCAGTENPLTLTITANMDCQAQFAQLSQPVTDTKTPIPAAPDPAPPILPQIEELAVDGNGDGILDNEQIYVITIPDAVTGDYLTLATHVGCPIALISALTEEEQATQNETYGFPQGLMYFELQCTQANVAIYFHGVRTQRTRPIYQKYGPIVPGDFSTTTWYTLPNVTFGTTHIEGKSVVTAHFTLTDGELGDNTGIDGRIVDPGGLAFTENVENVISFIAKTFSASRKAGIATITVNRNGLPGELSVDYATLDETAKAGQDYQAVKGSLTWANGERGDKTFTIPLSHDANVAAILKLRLNHLTLVEGAVLGIETATLTITDDDVLATIAPAQSVPILSSLRPSPLNTLYQGQYQLITDDIVITEEGSVSQLTFAAHVENQGLVSNSILRDTATLTGGTLSGFIENQGIITDVNFVGGAITGGTLAGTITNNSQVGGIIQDVQLAPNTTLSGGKIGGMITAAADSTIQDVQLDGETILMGGTLRGEISGVPEQSAQIGAVRVAPGTRLSHVRLSPTVQLPIDLVLGDGVIQPADPDNPTMADFGIEAAEIAHLDAKRLNEIEPSALSTFSAQDIEQIPPETFSAIKPEQMTHFTAEALGGLTIAQFEQLPTEAFGGLTSENMGGLPTEVLNELTPQHLKAFNVVEFQSQHSEDISKIVNNLDANQVIPADVIELLSPDWALDPKTGALTAPAGAKLTLQSLPPPADLPAQVALPNLPNLSKGFGLGGKGTPVEDGMKHSLENENLADFILFQDDKGILNVVGTGDSAGQKYTFIPDVNNVIQVEQDKIPIGLSVSDGGFYQITTPEGQQYRVIPAPQNPVALSEVLGDAEVTLGVGGDVLLVYEQETTTRRRRQVHQVLIFDPFVEPPPEEFCLEIAPEEFVCDFDNVPEELRPGLHFPPNTRDKKGPQTTARIVYQNGTAQNVQATLLDPDSFIKEGFKFEGVESILFNANGTFKVVHQGNPYLIVPNFNIEIREVAEAVKPSIVLNDNETLTYKILLETPDKATRKRRIVHQVLIFDPFIEPIPEKFCQEILPGEYLCDFDNVPAEI